MIISLDVDSKIQHYFMTKKNKLKLVTEGNFWTW